MPKKSFGELVDRVASVVDDFDSKIKSDPQIRAIYARPQPFDQRVDAAISYWRSRPDYVDVNRALLNRANFTESTCAALCAAVFGEEQSEVRTTFEAELSTRPVIVGRSASGREWKIIRTDNERALPVSDEFIEDNTRETVATEILSRIDREAPPDADG